MTGEPPPRAIGGAIGGAIWAEINLGCIRRNTEQLKGLLPAGSQLMTVVKANAYGHGAVESSRAALDAGATWLGVARVHEGRELREDGIDAAILLLSEAPNAEVMEVLDLELTPTVYSMESAAAISSAAGVRGKVGVHLKVDTGMHRYGVLPERARDLVEFIDGLPGVEIAGVWSHFSVADQPENPYTKQQFEKFSDVLEDLGASQRGWVRHIANSAGVITFPESCLDMVRCGIATYGIYPDPVLADRITLEPAMSIKSRVGMLKELGPQEPISYGHTHHTETDSMIATIPGGYADGIRRGLTNIGEVLINGQRFGMVGTITMDHLMADVSAGDVSVGDEVVFIGRQGDDEISAAEVAGRLGTIAYEVVCGIGARVPRVYVES